MKDADEILIALRRITRAIDLRSRQLVKQTGLTAPQLIVLDALRRDGPQAPSALARRISLSPATITSIVERLEKLSLVERSRRESDRRGIQISLTKKGEDVCDSAPELLQAGFLTRFRTLEDWERHMLIAALARIAHLMEAGDLDAAPILTLEEYGQSAES